MAADIILSILGFVFLVLGKTAIIWGPLLLGWFAFFMWHHFVAEKFIGGIEWVVLEIHVPREMQKTPLAMELFITNALFHQSFKGAWEIYWQGAVHFWYSLEIASIDGRVHFFIRVPSRLKKLVETQLYAQYPQVRVEQVEDYTLKIPKYKHNGNWYLWGAEWKLQNHDALPIKTYKDYGLDKVGTKEEDKIDPLSSTLEFLGSLERGEQLWMQIICRQSEKKYKIPGHGRHKVEFFDAALSYMEERIKPYTRAQKQDNAEGEFALDARVPEFLKDEIKDVKDKMSKLPFDVGIRLVVLADKRQVSLETFNNTRRASRLLFRQFNDPDSNSLIRFNPTQYDQTWADATGKFLETRKSRHLTYYKLRTMFYPPILASFNYPKLISYFFPANKPEYFVLSTTELATLYHFPGMVSETPSFQRLETKTSKPPSNLPI